jgi:hypothetical protein
MNPELQRAIKRHTQWFGSYKASGELKKIQVWLVVNGGQIEFLTPGNSYKVKRARRNPRVICYVGSKDGPAIAGTAEIITDRNEVARVYRSYWKAHPLADGDCDRTSTLDRDAVEPASGRSSPAGRAESASRTDRPCYLSAESSGPWRSLKTAQIGVNE